MSEKPPKTSAGKGGETREDRLKKALKANLARRKAQARARGHKADGQKEQG
ncbi:hypothetical protein SAMN05444722_3411 [Rhodovulum sp. ES.010]|uniref:hypothetical protein n=1 Tax=Rhodovulum sp. ES.010 TaxID=1882821 RepID=UPI000927FB49|nr:hypothetical protein [Rhodovulum sp. ES.010]SIO54776.1 hypothetical protein SAMN05444722_3411 [Rhodovulum sp. ES.010]